MSPHMGKREFRAAIEQLGFSQEGAAEFLGWSPRQGQRWALGERPVPIAETKLLRLMLQRRIKPEDVP